LASALQGVRFPTTVVARIDEASVVPGETAVEVLGIDPGTFSAAAFWDPRFAPDTLDDLLGRLSASGGLRVPAVVAGGDLTGDLTLRISGSLAPVHVVARAGAFPGAGSSGRPLVVVDAATLVRVAPGTAILADRGRQVWAKGDPATILPALRQRGVPVSAALSANEVERTPGFLAISWTFSFLQALGIVAAMVALIGLVLYLQSRQQSRDVGYALSTRMGLTRRAHRRSVAMELGGMLLAAFVIGSGLAAAATRLLYRKLDVLPAQAPAPVYRLPVTLLGGVALVLLLAALIGAAAVQRRASHANAAEVMRLAA
jgi:putative ABC transport system permease protein